MLHYPSNRRLFIFNILSAQEYLLYCTAVLLLRSISFVPVDLGAYPFTAYEQQSADEEDVEARGASSVVSESADAGDDDASALFSTRSDQGSPTSASRHEYVAEQLQQLSQIRGQSSRSSRPVAGTVPPNQPLSFTGTGGSYTDAVAGTATDSAASPGDSPGPRSASGAAAIVDATSQPPSTTAMLSPLSHSSSSGESAPLEISSPKISSPNPAAAPGIPTAEVDPATRGLELDSPSGSNLSSGSGAPSVVPPGASSENREQQQSAAEDQPEQLSDLLVADSRRRGGAGARASGTGTSSSRGGSSSSDSLMYSMSVESSLSSPFSAFTAAAWGSGHSSRRGNGSDASPPTKTPTSPHGVPLAPFEGGKLDLRRMAAGSAGPARRSGISQGRIFPGYGQATISSSSSSSSSSRGSSRDRGSVKSSRGDDSASLPGEKHPVVSGEWAPPVHSPKGVRDKDSAVAAAAADEGRTREEMQAESTRDKNSRRVKLVVAVGRAKVWGKMLEGEPRASPTLRTIEGENRTVLDQAVVLPCAPSDDEKVM